MDSLNNVIEVIEIILITGLVLKVGSLNKRIKQLENK